MACIKFSTYSSSNKSLNMYHCSTLSPRAADTTWTPFGPRFPYKKTCAGIHALLQKHLFFNRTKISKLRFFQRSVNPPSVLLFPPSLAPPWCHLTPIAINTKQDFTAVATASFFITCHHYQISLTLDPGGPGGPVGPPNPSNPAGPRWPFSPRLPGGPGGPWNQTLNWFTGLANKHMNNQDEGSNSPDLPWTPDHPSHLAQL